VRDQEPQDQRGGDQPPGEQPPSPVAALPGRCLLAGLAEVVFDARHVLGRSCLRGRRADATMARRAGSAESSAAESGRRARPAFQSAGVALRMSWWSLADARFLLERALGLARRGAISVRSRGWRATWLRIRSLLRFGAPRLARPLVFPSPVEAPCI